MLLFERFNCAKGKETQLREGKSQGIGRELMGWTPYRRYRRIALQRVRDRFDALRGVCAVPKQIDATELIFCEIETRQRRYDGCHSCHSLCSLWADVVAAEVQFLHLGDRALAQRVAQDGGAPVAQLVEADQNFGHRRADGDGWSQRRRTLWTKLVVLQIELRTGQR